MTMQSVLRQSPLMHANAGSCDRLFISPAADSLSLTERERELGAIVTAYNEVTERLKSAHERLTAEVSRLRDELCATNAELRRRERLAALGEMAAGLAHEIRNPLGGIALYASLLERSLGESTSELNLAQRISNGVRTLNRLVTEILDFAQEDRLDRTHCDFGSLMDGVMESVRPWSDERRIDVRIAPSALGVELFCDCGRMRQVLVNLVMNAVQAMEPGGIVAVNARRWSGSMEFEVRDHGPGINPDIMDRIFNPFVTTKSTGTGLGLAIVHRIVEAHGGTIRASNATGGGARFIVRLPDAPAAERRAAS